MNWAKQAKFPGCNGAWCGHRTARGAVRPSVLSPTVCSGCSRGLSGGQLLARAEGGEEGRPYNTARTSGRRRREVPSQRHSRGLRRQVTGRQAGTRAAGQEGWTTEFTAERRWPGQSGPGLTLSPLVPTWGSQLPQPSLSGGTLCLSEKGSPLSQKACPAGAPVPGDAASGYRKSQGR